MLTVICIMLAGVAAGWLMRPYKRLHIQGFITLLIWGLLFLLGLEVGGNRRIIEGLSGLGVEALAITSAAVAGSCLAAWGLWAVVSHKMRKGQ